MRVISVINLKGGVGKTTTSANLAYDLAEYHGCKVLVIDNDKQGNISRLFKAYDEDEDCGMYKVLLEKKLTDIIKYTDYTNIDIITANMTLLNANLMLMQTDAEEQHIRLRNYLSQLDNLNHEAYREYDYVIIDNPPTIDMCVFNALVSTDDVIVPVKVDEWGLKGLDVIAEQIEQAKEYNPCLQLLGVLITIYKKNDINVVCEEKLRKDSRYPIFETKIRRTDKADEATFFEKPVGEYSSRSAAARDYKALTLEYLRLTEE